MSSDSVQDDKTTPEEVQGRWTTTVHRGEECGWGSSEQEEDAGRWSDGGGTGKLGIPLCPRDNRSGSVLFFCLSYCFLLISSFQLLYNSIWQNRYIRWP